MCGIIGYLGRRKAGEVVLEGLKRLEYRGYDSAGVCALSPNGKFELVREVGKLSRLEEKLRQHPVSGTSAIGHSRWATHGPPSEENAHPHSDCRGDIVVVHNGIIENYQYLRRKLKAHGHHFRSQTDSEVIAHLFEEEARRTGAKPSLKTILAAVRRVVARLEGAYAVVVMAKPWQGCLVGIRKECPLVVGVGDAEAFLASDIAALLPFTRRVVHLNDGEIAILERSGKINFFNDRGGAFKRAAVEVDWNSMMAEKDGHKHYMLKEIRESPRAFEDTLRGRVYEQYIDALLDEARLTRQKVKDLRSVRMVACGTAHYAGMIGEYLMESWARLPSYAEIASEFRYKSRVLGPGTLAVAVSQSGETADTLAAIRLAKTSHARPATLSIVNQIGSTLTRETDGCIYTRCGPEIGVASTKAFFAQAAVFYLLSLAFGRLRSTLDSKTFGALTSELLEVPHQMRRVLESVPSGIQELAREFQHARSFLYLGRHLLYPVALEGALKLKEISYIHAEGYAAGEMKHGPIALIDPGMPIFAFAPKNSSVYQKTVSNLEEARARGGKIIVVASRGDKVLRSIADKVIEVPAFRHEWFEPMTHALVAHLFAYHVADLKGLDVDQPRNLAKSVTVE